MPNHNPVPELLTFAVLSLMIVVFLPDHAASALLSQIIQVMGDNTRPIVVLLLGLALIERFGPKR